MQVNVLVRSLICFPLIVGLCQVMSKKMDRQILILKYMKIYMKIEIYIDKLYGMCTFGVNFFSANTAQIL